MRHSAERCYPEIVKRPPQVKYNILLFESTDQGTASKALALMVPHGVDSTNLPVDPVRPCRSLATPIALQRPCRKSSIKEI